MVISTRQPKRWISSAANRPPETFDQAGLVALGEVQLRTSRHRATDAYRAEMVRVLLPRTLAQAAERARTSLVMPVGPE